jgi:protein-tyrosine phosphatase
MFQRIIVVCTGNICRSPIAEGLLRSRLVETGISVSSAGIAALVGHAADPFAQQVMQEHGYDISAHRAQQATQALLTSMDLILTLDQSHSEWIRLRFPQLQGRTYKLGRWSNNIDVADPYGRPEAAFEQSFAEISQYTDEWLKRIPATGM